MDVLNGTDTSFLELHLRNVSLLVVKVNKGRAAAAAAAARSLFWIYFLHAQRLYTSCVDVVRARLAGRVLLRRLEEEEGEGEVNVVRGAELAACQIQILYDGKQVKVD